jgi:tRNA A37 threonylcarbamoyladenosine synthetase subunit TsaC/SUA5/YrdC
MKILFSHPPKLDRRYNKIMARTLCPQWSGQFWHRGPRELGKYLARRLEQHRILLSETDTIPGLLGRISDEEAIAEVYRLKQRDPNKKLLMLAGSLEKAVECTTEEARQRVAPFLHRIWPGSVTVILPLAAEFGRTNAYFRQLGPSYAVRLPRPLWLRTMLAELGEPVFAPSANLSGTTPPKEPWSLVQTFARELSFAHFALPHSWQKARAPLPRKESFYTWFANAASTIIDLRSEPKILRQGSVSEQRLMELWRPGS